MTAEIDALKKRFREGHHAEAMAACKALSDRRPNDLAPRKLCATMHVVARNYRQALEHLVKARALAPEDADVLYNLGMCEKELKNFAAAAEHFSAYTQKFPTHPDGWASLADCKLHLGAFDECIAAARKALALDPVCLPARTVRGDAHLARGQTDAGLADYKAVLKLQPNDAATLQKASLHLLEANRGDEAIALCRDILKAHPDNLSAKLGGEWLLTQQVPLWHVPMMNEPERNQAFYDGLQAVVGPGKTVFEIGTGSGLLAMMAAKLGAAKVYTCEAVPLIAATADKIIRRNGFQEQVTMLAKPSHAVQLGDDLTAKADVLVHEVFSSELLGEHVLPAIEDAKARLLKPGGVVMPAVASIMVALVGGDALGKNVHVDDAFGFDLSDFNAIHPRKRPLYREDLTPVLMSEAVEAFRFDFANASVFPPERKRIAMKLTQAGRCYGVIQWIRIELAEGVTYENHPSRRQLVSNWQHTIYGFAPPLDCTLGEVLQVNALHDRSRPWFELAPGGRKG